MKNPIRFWVALSGLLLACLLVPASFVSASGARIDYDRDIQPILSENCFTCHGLDTNKRQAALRLDTAEGAFKRLDTGHTAVVPGRPESSEVIRRITVSADMRMPPTNSGKHLTPAQIATLRAWIAQGARYAPHWAFVAPKRPPIPPVKDRIWARNPIDQFVLARLEKEGLHPSPEADRGTLLRRVTLDLTGLPPPRAELDAFVSDRRPDAYERVVDRLLASPHYGERMAQVWLDLARYADTHGYHIDSQRDMWRWRDWVIGAFNTNMPYDQFTVEQLAGDLLPNATLSQKIATGFNRNHPISFEGGAIPEEYQANYIFDRIDTTATSFMGLTMRCAQCHDHKYDPISQKEYYRFYAYFNSIAEQGLDGQQGNAAPFIKAPLPEQQAQAEANSKQIASLEEGMKQREAETKAAQADWERNMAASPDRAGEITDGQVAHYRLDEPTGAQIHDAAGKQPIGTLHGNVAWTTGKSGGALRLDGSVYGDMGTAIGFERTDRFSYGAWVYPTTNDAMTVVSRMEDKNDFRGWDLYLGDGKVFVHMIHKWEQNALRINSKTPLSLNVWHHLFVTYDGSSKAKGITLYVDGKPAEVEVTHDTLTDTIRSTVPMLVGRRNPGAPFRGMIDEVRIYNRTMSAAEVAQLADFDSIRDSLLLPSEKRTPAREEALRHYYLDTNDAPYRKLKTEMSDWQMKQTKLDSAIPTTMVMQELPKPRDTFVLIRGQYDQHGEKVTPSTPAILPPLAPGAPPNRLALARWLVSPTHPLTARVAVNRYWQMYFGTGIVKTVENFGMQGERPSHPELLDWLATEFIRTKWDVKAMQRLIVTSATYRQASRATPALLERDPENRLLARGPRYRLPAEFVRDQALALSGLLVPKVGGPSVKPYQPAGLWEELAFGAGFSAQSYQQDHGEALYRRSLYTFWKRTCPPPDLQTFDAPEREYCVVRRSVTNTPLQGLVLMNDPIFVEASRKFAERIVLEGGATPQARVDFAFRLAVARTPRPSERDVLLGVYKAQLARFAANPDAARKLLSVGESPCNTKLDSVELAAWTLVANVIMNLDETITKN